MGTWKAGNLVPTPNNRCFNYGQNHREPYPGPRGFLALRGAEGERAVRRSRDVACLTAGGKFEFNATDRGKRDKGGNL